MAAVAEELGISVVVSVVHVKAPSETIPLTVTHSGQL